MNAKTSSLFQHISSYQLLLKIIYLMHRDSVKDCQRRVGVSKKSEMVNIFYIN